MQRRKKKRQPAAPGPAIVALRLLGAWTRLSQGHVAMSLGCSCGVAGTNLRVGDYEAGILDFLQGRHGAVAGSIADLLAGIAKAGAGAPASSVAVLRDLERSLQSFEQQHSGR